MKVKAARVDLRRVAAVEIAAELRRRGELKGPNGQRAKGPNEGRERSWLGELQDLSRPVGR